MRLNIKYLLCVLAAFLLLNIQAQTTSWTGTTSTNWSTASNWTSGVPTASLDAIIGDASFTGANQPALTATSVCKSLIIGTGTKASTLNIGRNITVNGSVTIGSNGTILASSNNRTITLKGNWSNSGTYNATVSTAGVTLSGGVTQTFTGATTFRRLTVNSGSTLLLASNITVNNSLSVSGTVNPATYAIGGSGTLTINSTGTILVYTSVFTGNYPISGTKSISRTSTVNYASAVIDQTVSSAMTYGTLRISGGTIKSLASNLPALSSSNSSSGRIFIDAGTFDLKTFTANRSAAGGGSITISAGAKLMIGGTNGFPANYLTHSIASTSTVEYYGNNQTVAATTYGNLVLKATSGSVTKTMPASALVIAGDFSMAVGTGTAVSATAAQNITFNGSVSIGAGTSFSAASFTHTFKSNFYNAGTFNGNTSTAVFSGISAGISGSGSHVFNNLSFTAFGITANGASTISVTGNLSTTTPGLFTHLSGGSLTMSGTAKTLSGNGLAFNNLIVNGSVTSTANMSVNGNLTTNGSLTSSAGSVLMRSSSGQINGSVSPTFFMLEIEGNISTALGFTMLSNLSVSASGSLTASSGNVIFNGSSTLNGVASLYDVTINATRTLALGNSSVLGINNSFTRTGTFDVTTYVPNTVNFNRTGNQTVPSANYHNLIVSGSGTKTTSGAITVNNDITIQSGVVLDASVYTHSIYRHWNNFGAFTASSSDIQLRGSNAANLTGVSTFNTLTVNKSSAQVPVTLLNNVTAASVVMTAGRMYTGSNSITTTGSRTGNGIIIGTVVHNHAFVNATPYAFEGPNNLITFNNPSGINQVTVTSKLGEISDFDPAIESVNREYEISIPSGTYTSAILRYHYENNELNAFAEPFLSIYKHNTGTTWDSIGFVSRDTAANYVEMSGISALDGRFSASGIRNIVRWNGSVSTDWNDSMNWTTISGSNMNRRVPTVTDAAQIGYAAFTNQPVVTASNVVSVLRLGSTQSVHLTINSGALSSSGSIRGQWDTTKSHIIETLNGALFAGTDLSLSDGSAGHDIHLKIASGAVTVNEDLIQSGSGMVSFTGIGSLNLLGNYTYTSGTFNAGSGTVVYSGSNTQTVANVVYNNLTLSKSGSVASISSAINVLGNLNLNMGGELHVLDSLNVAGNLTIGASTLLELENSVLSLGGNFQMNGAFVSNSSKVRFTGNGAQSCGAVSFNNLEVDKPAGTLSLAGNVSISGDFNLMNGAVDIDTFRLDRSFEGGIFSLDSNATLYVAGSSHFPARFLSNALHAASTVVYDGAQAQYIRNITYGNLSLMNGSSNSKSLLGNIRINGNFDIASGATFEPDIYSLNLYGNFSNSGTFMPGSSTVTLNGSGKTIAGTTTFNNLSVVEGAYTVSTGTITMNGDLYVESTGSLNFGNNAAILDGDLTNKGTLISNGTATFTGTRVQTFQLLNAITSTSTGVINFNGTVEPVINSSSSPAFATVNINNTAGIRASVPWFVYVSFNVSSGATFNGGPLTHTFYGNFTNNGTVNSDGLIRFTPGAPFSASASVKLDGTLFNSSGAVEFGGTAPISITQTAPVLNVVRITNTHSSGVTAPGSWNIADELRIGTGALFNAGSLTTHLISGSLINDGTLQGQGSTFQFNGSPAEINGTGNTFFNHFEIVSGADLTLNTVMHVSRDFTADGAFNGNGGKVVFNGTPVSAINGTALPLEFGDLEINKSGGNATLAIPVTVNGDLILTLGNLVTSAANYLNIADDASSSSGSSVSYVSGPMRKTGDDAFVFPVGKGGSWARIAISAPASVTDAFTAEYFNAPYSNTTSMDSIYGPVMNNVSIQEYWDLSRTAGTSSVNVQLYWENSLSGINNYSSDLVVAHWNGSAWENTGQSAITASVPGNVTSNSVSSFSPFTFGSLSPSINPLPIKLLSFSAQMNASGAVDLLWKTVSETDNSHFTVEKSTDGKHFTEVLTLKAAGNAQTVQVYEGSDQQPYAGISYYRLKQTDLSGHTTISATVMLVNGHSDGQMLSVYPNPANGVVQIANGRESGTLTIRNSIGYVVGTIELTDGFTHADLSSYPDGVYYLILESGGFHETVKLIKY